KLDIVSRLPSSLPVQPLQGDGNGLQVQDRRHLQPPARGAYPATHAPRGTAALSDSQARAGPRSAIIFCLHSSTTPEHACRRLSAFVSRMSSSMGPHAYTCTARLVSSALCRSGNRPLLSCAAGCERTPRSKESARCCRTEAGTQ